MLDVPFQIWLASEHMMKFDGWLAFGDVVRTLGYNPSKHLQSGTRISAVCGPKFTKFWENVVDP